MITACSDPVFGGVYKLVAIEDEAGNIIPKIKVSENPVKITNPHFKKVYRIYRKCTGKAVADQICIWDEVINENEPLEIFDPQATWKRKTITDFYVRELQQPIFKNGQLVYQLPSLQEIRAYCQEEISTLWEEVQRFENPHHYYVDLSWKLWHTKEDMLRNKK